MAAMMRKSVTSLVRTWPSTIIRRAAAKSIIGGFHVRSERRPLYRVFEWRPARFVAEKTRKQRRRAFRVLRLRSRAWIVSYPHSKGHVAEWLRNGLQNRVPRFNSGRGLQLPCNFASERGARRGAHCMRATLRRRAARPVGEN